MTPLRVLLTNIVLCGRSGTETYTRDLALELQRRGHVPTVYSPDPGVVGDELRADGVRVVAHLNDELPPDVIHGHHHVEAMSAVLRFPGVPTVFVCHGPRGWHDRPPIHPRVRAYVAVDEPCRDRFPADGVDRARVRVIPNSVDLDRFRPRGLLPQKPRRALLFSHYAAEHTHLPVVREACRLAGLELTVAGLASGNSCARPEDVLGDYDIVFGKARCALEAMAVGCAVVLCDPAGVGPMVQADQWDALRPLNFGFRACVNPLTPESLLAEIARYDPADAAEVCRKTRAGAGVGAMVDALLAVYGAVIRAQISAPVDPEAEARAAAEYLRTRLAKPEILSIAQGDLEQAWAATWTARTRAESAQREGANARRERDEARAAVEDTHRELVEVRLEFARAAAEWHRAYEWVTNWRLRWKTRASRLWSGIQRTCSPWRGC
jgi:hypothetical protein